MNPTEHVSGQWSDVLFILVMGAVFVAVCALVERWQEIRRARVSDELPPTGLSWIDGRDELRPGR